MKLSLMVHIKSYFAVSFYLLDIVYDTCMYNEININRTLVQAC